MDPQPALSEETMRLVEAYRNVQLVTGSWNRPSESWKILFDYFNARLVEKGGRPYGMGCQSCYRTVYNWTTALMISLKVI